MFFHFSLCRMDTEYIMINIELNTEISNEVNEYFAGIYAKIPLIFNINNVNPTPKKTKLIVLLDTNAFSNFLM